LLPGKQLTVWLLVKDADLYPVRVRMVKFRIWDIEGRVSDQVFEPEARCESNLQHLAFSLPLVGFTGDVRITGWITVENARGQRRLLENHNLPGLLPSPLEVRLLESPLPYPREWHAGEMHCHSEFSSDPVEFGAPLDLMQQTADAVGLDFVLCTDHSYDFAYRRDRYLEPCDPTGNFAAYRAQAEALNASHPGRPTIVPGEEISCGNSRGENVHLLAFGHPDFVPGLGDGGRRGFRNRPDLTVAETLERLGDTPSFAAHPKARIGLLERAIFRRGEWRGEDLATAGLAGGSRGRSVRGLQFWNGNLGPDYLDGKAFWVQELLRGNHLLPIGANDAHGDFNRNTGVKFPLVSLKQGRDHVFGRVRTLVPAPGRDADSLRGAFRGDRCVCTDGPFAELVREDGGFRVAAFSTGDFGTLQSVTVYGAESGDASERVLSDWTFEDGPLHFEERIETPLSSGYARLEAITRQGRRAMTAAMSMSG
jgi:hypothetical protein